MPMVRMRLCYLCYQDGLEKKAIANYVDTEGSNYDVCQKHLELVKKLELLHKEINPIMETW